MNIFVLFSFLFSLSAYAGGEKLDSELAPERERLLNIDQYCDNHCQCKGDKTYCYCPLIGSCYCTLGDRSHCLQKERDCKNLPEWKNNKFYCNALAELGEPCEEGGKHCECKRTNAECYCRLGRICRCAVGESGPSVNICWKKERECKNSKHKNEWENQKFSCKPQTKPKYG